MKQVKYKLKSNPVDVASFSPVQDYLQQLGIVQTDSFIGKPAEWDQLDPTLLDNIEAAVRELHYAFTNKKRFYLQPDSDVDGYTSAAIFYRYFKDLYPEAEIHWEVHYEKEHGIKLEKIPVWVDYVIMPDAGANDFDEQEELARRGQKVIILDHHHVENFREVEGVIQVNNQLSDRYTNKFLSGAGVVYKTIELYSKMFGDGKSHENFLDLAAIGVISDMMDSRELDNNYIIYHGLRNIRNPLIQAILERQAFSVSNVRQPNKIDIAFYVAPLINGLIRMGTMDQNAEFFAALIDYNNKESFVQVTNKGMKAESLYEKVARESANVRARQNTLKEKAMEYLDQEIQENGSDENSIIVVKSSKTDDVTLPKSMTGLVAMEFVKKYQKPILVLRPRTVDGVKMYAGSGRSKTIQGFESFKDELNNSGIVSYAQGHDNAFGCQVESDKVNELIQYFNNNFPGLTFGDEVTEVDYAFENEKIAYGTLYQFAEVKHIYGNQIPQPRFAFKIKVRQGEAAVIGNRKNTLKLQHQGIDFIAFHQKELIEELTNGDDQYYSIMGEHEFTIIGRPDLNEFNGNVSLQIMIDEISAVKTSVDTPKIERRGIDLI